MRRFSAVIIISLSVITVAAVAQVTQQPSPPTTPRQSDTPFSPRGLPASPVNNGLPASPANPGLPGFSNFLGPWFTNGVGTNFQSSDLSALLVNLQNDMQQLLPVLAAINGSALLGGTNGSVATGTVANSGGINPAAGGRAPANFGNLVSRDLSTRVSQDLSSRVGGSTTTTLPNTPATPMSINGTNVAALLGAGTNASTGTLGGFFSGNGTNGFFLTSAEQDGFRALVILQNDIERTLPIVASLNGGAIAGLPSTISTNTAINNRSFVGTNNIFAPPSRTPPVNNLLPTGR